MEEKFQTFSDAETKKIAAAFAKKLKDKEVICFFGDLGAGKTTFIQGLALGLGITQRVNSPTFIIMRRYPFIRHDLQIFFYHADLYRIENSKQAESIGLKEIFEMEKGIICIEWSERIQDILPKERWEITLKDEGEDKREIKIKKLN
jgi:tRNA threonylcarbamoyladenosine biosynthesis protein TsaE